MPLDLAAVDRGFGECIAVWNEAEILLRYRVDLDGRAMHAIRRAIVGAPMLGQVGTRIPDTEMAITELVRVLLPSGPNVPEDDRGWDLTRAGVSIPVTEDELMRLSFEVPIILLSTIMQDIQNPNRRRPSRGGSPRGASSTVSQTTTASSATPNGQGSLPGPLPALTTVGSGSAGESGFGV